MILEFGAVNFYSFKEGFTVDLRLPEKNSDGKGYTNILGIKGANASGKTNVMKLLSFIAFFAKSSFSDYKPGENVLISSYFNNEEPISIYAIFLSNEIEYKYELGLLNGKIISEVLYRKKNRYVRVIERQNDTIVYTSTDFSELKTMKLRDNASLVSSAKQYDLKSINPVYALFDSIITNVSAHGRVNNITTYKKISQLYHKSPDMFKFVIEVLKTSDVGIESIEIKKDKDAESGENTYYPIFKHKTKDGIKNLTIQYESGGTKSLYLELGLYNIALSLGATLVLDEFDVYLHPDLLPMLIDLFETKNKNNAQLIFTTHNNEIMDKLGKYRTILVNKIDSESFLYRLDEIPGDMIRNDRPITPIYASGKIGGKPRLLNGK